MKARIAVGIGIIIVIIIVVSGFTIFAGNETNKSTELGQNSTSSPPPGRHLSVDLSERVGIRQNP